jgi:hypothetical protein
MQGDLESRVSPNFVAGSHWSGAVYPNVQDRGFTLHLMDFDAVAGGYSPSMTVN